MNFAVVGPTYPFRGGIAHYTTLLVKHLRARHSVRFFSYRRQYPSWLFPGNTARDPSQVILEEECERSLDALNPLTWLATARRMASGRPDVLLLQWWTPFWMPLYACLISAARRAHIPVVYLCHQLVEPDSPAVEWWLSRIGLGWADAYIGVTASEQERLRRAFPRKPVWAGFLPAYDVFPARRLERAQARSELGVLPETPLLLFFGFVRRYKGLPYLLDALHQTHRPVHLIVAGEFWEDETIYRRMIADYQLQERVALHNRYVPNEDVERYFVAADALVLPYLSGSQSAVGSTALHFGLPTICTSVGGLAETVRNCETGLVVPPGDSTALAEAIDRCFDDGCLGAFRSNLAHDRERLSWSAFVELLEQLSHALVAPRGTEKAQAIHAST